MLETPTISPDELKARLADLERVAGTRFAPLGVDSDVLVRKTQDELNKAYPARWDRYVKALKALRVSAKSKTRREATDGSDTQKEVQMTRLLRRLTMLNNYEQHMAEIRDNKGATPLRANQMPMYEAFGGFLEKRMGEENPRGYCVLPTGSGKTVIFSQLLYTFLTHHEKNEEKSNGSSNITDSNNAETAEKEFDRPKALIVVPSLPLVSQTVASFKNFFPGLRVGEFHSSQKGNPQEVDIMVTTYASAVNRAVEGEALDPSHFDIVILDEVHRSLTDRRKETVDGFGKSVILGFTATPDFSEDKETKDLLPHEIMNVRLTEAHDMGLICPFKVAVADTQVDISSVDIDNGSYDEAQLEKLINTQARNQAVVELHHQLGTKNKFIGFCSTRAHCDAVADSFASPTKGQVKLNVFSWTDIGTIKSGLVNSEGKALKGEELKTELARRLRLPHNDPNAIHGIVSVQKALEGFDEPILTHCYNVTPTCSRINATQRAGRVMRLVSETDQMILGGPKTAYVVDFRDQDRRNEQVLFTDILMEDIRKSKPNNAEGKPSITEDEVKEILSRYITTPQGVVVEGLKFNISLQEVYDITRREKHEPNQNTERPLEIGWKQMEAELLRSCPLIRKNHIPNVDIRRAIAWVYQKRGTVINDFREDKTTGSAAQYNQLGQVVSEYWASIAQKFEQTSATRSITDIAEFYGMEEYDMPSYINYAYDSYIRAGKFPIIEYVMSNNTISEELWQLIRLKYSKGLPDDPSRDNNSEQRAWSTTIHHAINPEMQYVDAKHFFTAINKPQHELILRWLALNGMTQFTINDGKSDEEGVKSGRYLTPDAARAILTWTHPQTGLESLDTYCKRLGLPVSNTRDMLLGTPNVKDLLTLYLPLDSSRLIWYINDQTQLVVTEHFRREVEKAKAAKEAAEARTAPPGWISATTVVNDLSASLIKIGVRYNLTQWLQSKAVQYLERKHPHDLLVKNADPFGARKGIPHYSPLFCSYIALLMHHVHAELKKVQDPGEKSRKALQLFGSRFEQLLDDALYATSDDPTFSTDEPSPQDKPQGKRYDFDEGRVIQKIQSILITPEHEVFKSWQAKLDVLEETLKKIDVNNNKSMLIAHLISPLTLSAAVRNMNQKKSSSVACTEYLFYDGTLVSLPKDESSNLMWSAYEVWATRQLSQSK